MKVQPQWAVTPGKQTNKLSLNNNWDSVIAVVIRLKDGRSRIRPDRRWGLPILGVNLTNVLQLAPRLRMGGFMSLLSLCAVILSTHFK